MKALSVMPYYCMQIYRGEKTVEWRSWRTPHRGDLLFCASARKEPGCVAGYALFVAELYDVVPFGRRHLDGACLDWVPDPPGYAWLLRDMRPVEPFPVKGKLHLYEVEDRLIHTAPPIFDEKGELTRAGRAWWDRFIAPLVYTPEGRPGTAGGGMGGINRRSRIWADNDDDLSLLKRKL